MTVSAARNHPDSFVSPRDRPSRHMFWIDDRVIDCFAPVMSRYPFGASALAVYIVLARRADREGDSWPRLELIATESGTSERTVQRAIRLLEVLGLVEVALCYEQGSNRQTSNLYTLLTPPDPLPEIDPDPDKWPAPNRRTLLVRGGHRAESMSAARVQRGARDGPGSQAARPAGAGPRPISNLGEAGVVGSTPRQADTPPASHSHPPGVSLTPQEGNTSKDNTVKERSSGRKDREKCDGCQKTASDPSSPSRRLADFPSFVIAEIGLTNRQVWAATLGELARRGEVGRADLESWLRPAALIGREGKGEPGAPGGPAALGLILGAPNAVTRDRIATRLLPAVREALGATIGAPVAVSVVVVGDR